MKKFPQYPDLNLQWIKKNLDLDHFLECLNYNLEIPLTDDRSEIFAYYIYLSACESCLHNKIKYNIEDLITETGIDNFNGHPSTDVLKSCSNGSFLTKINNNFKVIKKLKVRYKKIIVGYSYNIITRYDLFYSKKNNTYYLLEFFGRKPVIINKGEIYEYYNVINKFLTQKTALEFIKKELKKIKKT